MLVSPQNHFKTTHAHFEIFQKNWTFQYFEFLTKGLLVRKPIKARPESENFDFFEISQNVREWS